MNLEEILSIPTCTGSEDMMIEYIVRFGQEHGIRTHLDHKRNVYMTKGELSEGESYPCVVAHTDTVYLEQRSLVSSGLMLGLLEGKDRNGSRILTALNPENGRPAGIGGDNKCGVFIALRMILEFDVIKAAFFVEEETGMQGSKEADDSFFKDVGYALQFDAPTRNWFSSRLMSLELWNEGFIDKVKPVLDSFEIDNITSGDPFTDVLQIRKKYRICCAVFPTGYYNQHSIREYVVPNETEECVKVGIEAVKALGRNKYPI